MTPGLHKVFDAAFPPETAPPGAEGVIIYIGRPGFTPHVWTITEADRFASLRQFPAWLPDLNDTPQADARLAVSTARNFGWAAFIAEPEKRLIIFDGETSQIPAYYELWAQEVTAGGFFPVDYGSYSTVFGNAARDVWAADWNGIPELMPGQTVGADQYRANIPWENTRIDLSVAGDALFARGGRGARHLKG